jgi:single-strand DNA-binding protein
MARYSVNKVILVGNLGRDPEIRYTPAGQAVANFSLATSRGRKDPSGNWTDETEWHRIVAWERLAEMAGQSLHKGSKVYVEGRIQSRKYTDNQGVERTSFDIVANDLTLLDRREAGGDASGDDWGDAQSSAAPQQQRPQRPQPQRKAPADEETFAGEEFDDVPF